MNANESISKILLERFREDHKSHTLLYLRNIVGVKSEMPRTWEYRTELYSWSFETTNFKPAKQMTADILVFRYKKYKGQKKCDLRIVHKIQKNN